MKRNLLLFVVGVLFSCSGVSQKEIGQVSLVFLKRDISDYYIIKDIKQELFTNSQIDSIKIEGEEYPVIEIELSSKHIMMYGITIDDVRKAIFQEIDIKEVKTKERGIIIFKESDFDTFQKYKDPNEIMFIPIKIVSSGAIIQLRDVARISLKLRKDEVLYQGNKVNLISFYFNGKIKEELLKAIEPLEKYGLKYKLVIGRINYQLIVH